MAIVANFTPDTIEWTHIGVVGTLKPDEIEDFNTGRANHILSKYGNRGLVRLELGDDKEEIIKGKRKVAMKMWRDFWLKQIAYHNQHNENLKNSNCALVDPAEDLRDHAEKLGVDLIGPWSIKQFEKDKEVTQLREDNAQLRRDFDELKRLITMTNTREEASANYDSIRSRFKTLNRNNLAAFVNENAADIMAWPMAIVLELKDKYKKFYDKDGKDSWPLAQ